MHPRSLSLSLPVSGRNNKRLPAPDRELIHAPYDPPHGVICQGPDHLYTVPLHNLLLTVKDGISGHRPVYDFRSRPPGQALSGLDFLAVPWCMCPFRPDDRLSVAPGHQHEPLPGSRCAIVRRYQLPVFDHIAKIFKLLLPLSKGLTGF